MVKKKTEANTEAEILEAAKRVFRTKGYAGARMQEIADEAKINKAMLHYYFRSKELLFQQVFNEAMQGFFGTIVLTMNDPATSWKEKLHQAAERYTSFLKANPGVPVFIISELNQGQIGFFDKLPVGNALKQSLFTRQLLEAQMKKEIRPVAPLQIIVMMISGLVFPFMAKPIVKKIGGLNESEYNEFLDERKVLVPDMVISYLEQNKSGKK